MKARKIFTLVLSAIMLVSLLPTNIAFAERAPIVTDDGRWEYVYDGNHTATITKYISNETNPDTVIEIPETIGDRSVCKVTANFAEVSAEKVIFPKTVSEIEPYSFMNANGIKEVDLSKTALSEVPKSLFYRASSLKKVSLPENATSIREYAFYECENLSEVTFPTNLEKIEISAFEGCAALANISIPNSVERIDDAAFMRTGIKTLILPKNLKKWACMLFPLAFL